MMQSRLRGLHRVMALIAALTLSSVSLLLGSQARAQGDGPVGLDSPSAARLASGKFVMVGDGYSLTYAGTGPSFQIYGADGVPFGQLTQVRPAGGDYPRAAAVGNGFVVVYRYGWPQNIEPPKNNELRARFFDAAGAKFGPEFTITQTNWPRIAHHDVAQLADGGFVVVWAAGPDGPGTYESGEIYARRYNARGGPSGAQFRVNTILRGRQNRPRVAALADGGFVVVWNTYSTDYLDDVHAQRFGSSGQKIGGEFRVTHGKDNWEEDPVVAGLKSGGFVIAWTDTNISVQSVRARRFTTAGLPSGPEFLVAESASGAALAALDDGRFLLTYCKNTGIYGRLFGPTADPGGDDPEFLVSLDPPGSLQNYDATTVALSKRTAFVLWSVGDINHPPKVLMRKLDLPRHRLHDAGKITQRSP